ncbi:hypothetical protein EAF04_006781 [Stromatinia cepivora]|nr:hypothetical protein EAF04_006781 [Stromatinia cepivora]
MLSLNDFVARLQAWRSLVQSCLVLLGLGIANFLIKLYRMRHKFQRMQINGLPMPPHHPLFGHLKLIAGIMSQLPSDAHSHILPHQMKLLFPDLGPMFYMDTWPFGPQFLVVTAPDPAYQITQSHSLPKYYALREYLRPMTGGSDLVSMEGSQWKTWRNIFNPGFSGGHLMTLVPEMMKEISIFCDILRNAAVKSDIILMDPLTTRLSLDMIGRVALDTHLDSQVKTNSFVAALLDQNRWLSFGNEVNLIKRYHPFRPMKRWWNNRRMEQYIWRELDLRFKSKHGHSGATQKIRSKTIIDLALNNYLGSKPQSNSVDAIDTIFRDFATSQIRTFVFAGHDTTSSTMCYAFHLLSTHPNARQLMINEHDLILGPDHNQAGKKIEQDPRLLNRLPYTLAVIKETLRLYPPASTTRSGEPGYFISGPNGLQYPTDGFLVWSNSHAIHRDSNYWPDPDKFLPERWLVQEGDRLYPPKSVYRPFEHGPRNCIGQELAMLELKIVLVMTARVFDIKSVYGEWDRIHPRAGPRTIDGDRAYQILSGAAHPSDGLPCRVTLVAH